MQSPSAVILSPRKENLPLFPHLSAMKWWDQMPWFVECWRIDAFELWYGEDSWGSLGMQGDQTNQFKRKSTLNIHWKDWFWSWSFSTLATWCKELTHLERLWCWIRLRAGEEGDKGWDGWMASSTQWTWVWANSRRQWRIRNIGMLQTMALQRVRHNLATEHNNNHINFMNLNSNIFKRTRPRN